MGSQGQLDKRPDPFAEPCFSLTFQRRPDIETQRPLWSMTAEIRASVARPGRGRISMAAGGNPGGRPTLLPARFLSCFLWTGWPDGDGADRIVPLAASGSAVLERSRPWNDEPRKFAALDRAPTISFQSRSAAGIHGSRANGPSAIAWGINAGNRRYSMTALLMVDLRAALSVSAGRSY